MAKERANERVAPVRELTYSIYDTKDPDWFAGFLTNPLKLCWESEGTDPSPFDNYFEALERAFWIMRKFPEYEGILKVKYSPEESEE